MFGSQDLKQASSLAVMLKPSISYLMLTSWVVSLLPVLSDLIPHPLSLQFYKILIAELLSVVFQQFLEIIFFKTYTQFHVHFQQVADQ